MHHVCDFIIYVILCWAVCIMSVGFWDEYLGTCQLISYEYAKRSLTPYYPFLNLCCVIDSKWIKHRVNLADAYRFYWKLGAFNTFAHRTCLWVHSLTYVFFTFFFFFFKSLYKEEWMIQNQSVVTPPCWCMHRWGISLSSQTSRRKKTWVEAVNNNLRMLKLNKIELGNRIHIDTSK